MAEIGCLARLRSRVFAHGYHPVSETGALLIMQRGNGLPSRSLGEGWSPGQVLPLRLLGVGQTRYYFTTGRKLAAGNGWSPEALQANCRSRDVPLAKLGRRFYKRFFAKARPEELFRYRSKATARSRSLNAIAVLISQGRYFEVCGTSPLLCFNNRLFRSSVQPV